MASMASSMSFRIRRRGLRFGVSGVCGPPRFECYVCGAGRSETRPRLQTSYEGIQSQPLVSAFATVSFIWVFAIESRRLEARLRRTATGKGAHSESRSSLRAASWIAAQPMSGPIPVRGILADDHGHSRLPRLPACRPSLQWLLEVMDV